MINNLKKVYRLFSDMNVLSAVKYCEIRLLKSMSSSYCYNYPYWIQLESTNRCNLSCVMCARKDELKEKGYDQVMDMSFDTYRTIVDQLKHLKVFHIFGRGEPLMNPEIFDMIEYAKRIGIPYVSITTNGLLLKEEKALTLSKSGLDRLVISIDGPDEAIYKKIRNANLQDVVNNVKQFTSLSKMPVYVNAVLNRINYESMYKMPAFVKSIGAKGLNVGIVTENLTVTRNNLNINYEGQEKKRHTDQIVREAESEGIDILIRPQRITSCFAPSLKTFIDVKGNLTPCCRLEEVILGNILESGFWNVWNGKKLRSWRTAIAKGYIPQKCRDVKCITKEP